MRQLVSALAQKIDPFSFFLVRDVKQPLTVIIASSQTHHVHQRSKLDIGSTSQLLAELSEGAKLALAEVPCSSVQPVYSWCRPQRHSAEIASIH